MRGDVLGGVTCLFDGLWGGGAVTIRRSCVVLRRLFGLCGLFWRDFVAFRVES